MFFYLVFYGKDKEYAMKHQFKKLLFLNICTIFSLSSPIFGFADDSFRELKLTPSNGTERDHFGRSVSTTNNYAIVGAPNDNENCENCGAAYILSGLNERETPGFKRTS